MNDRRALSMVISAMPLRRAQHFRAVHNHHPQASTGKSAGRLSKTIHTQNHALPKYVLLSIYLSVSRSINSDRHRLKEVLPALTLTSLYPLQPNSKFDLQQHPSYSTTSHNISSDECPYRRRCLRIQLQRRVYPRPAEGKPRSRLVPHTNSLYSMPPPVILT